MSWDANLSCCNLGASPAWDQARWIHPSDGPCTVCCPRSELAFPLTEYARFSACCGFFGIHAVQLPSTGRYVPVPQHAGAAVPSAVMPGPPKIEGTGQADAAALL